MAINVVVSLNSQDTGIIEFLVILSDGDVFPVCHGFLHCQ